MRVGHAAGAAILPPVGVGQVKQAQLAIELRGLDHILDLGQPRLSRQSPGQYPACP
jgi:hypothetical protein